MKRTLSGVSAVLMAALMWSGCGGNSSSTSNTKKLSNVKDRVFVSNSQSGDIQIVDVANDKLLGRAFDITAGSSPTFMDSTPDGKNIAFYDAGFTAVGVANSDTENLTAKASLSNTSDSIRITSDAKFVYAAVRNRINTAPAPNGAVQVLDVTNNVISASYPVPNVRWIALSPDNKKLLAFPDDNSNIPYYIDLSASAPAAVPIPGTWDRPIAAYFTSDGSKAYVLNCGPGCGGVQASVSELMISGFTQRSVDVPAANVGVLDGSTLYVAGEVGTAGSLSVIDTGAMTVGSSTAIANGLPGVMRSVSGKVWVGSSGCNGGGCLTVFDTASKTATVDNPASGSSSKGDVTGMDFDKNVNQMFVCEGGELRRYDAAGNPVSTEIDIVGRAFDVRAVPAITK